jgi:hypothetical protein
VRADHPPQRTDRAVFVRTCSGRAIPAPPQIRTESVRQANRDLLKQREWLVEHVRAEAHARTDGYAGTLFAGLNPKNFSPADADSCNLYLFGDVNPHFDSTTGERLK